MQRQITLFIDHYPRTQNFIFEHLIKDWEKIYTFDQIYKAFNTPFVEWKYGNILHGIIISCFKDFLNCEIASSYCLSVEQFENALNVILYIIQKYHVNKFDIDTYAHTPYMLMLYIAKNTQSKFDDNLKKIVIKFLNNLVV